MSSADCDNSVYPKSAAGDLLPKNAEVNELLAIASSPEPLCVVVAQDLAQLYFWGSADVPANLARSYAYALHSRSAQHWPYDLRFIRSAYVLAGMDDSVSAEEALRQFQREIDSGEVLRRDKALATLNQLLNILPPSEPIAEPIYADRQHRKVIAKANIIATLARRGSQLRLLRAEEGALSLAWAGVGDADSRPRQDGIGPVLGALYKQPGDFITTEGGLDRRHQIWRTPSSAPDTGVLISRFALVDGSEYESRCTGTQLNEQWLISAAHCLFAPDGSQNIVSLRFIASPLTIGDAIAVAAVWVHRNHNPADQFSGEVARYSGSDLALIQLATTIATNNTPRLAALAADSHGAWVDSFAYPSDKERDSLWYSHCRAGLWLRGESLLSDVYSLDCTGHEGQSGAALLQTIAGTPHIVGVLSARVHSEKINQPVFSALNDLLVADIKRVIERGANNLTLFRALDL